MLCFYKTLMTNMSSNIFKCCVYRAAADTLNDFTWIRCASCLFNTARFIFIYSSHFWHSHQTRENVSQTLLHTVSKKHVIQPRNRSKTLGTGVSLNVPQVLQSTNELMSWIRCDIWVRFTKYEGLGVLQDKFENHLSTIETLQKYLVLK